MATTTLALQSIPATVNTLVLQDLSVYDGPPSYPLCTILLPGTIIPQTFPFTTGTSNVYTSPLATGWSDGLYTATLDVSPYNIYKIQYSFFKTEQFQTDLSGWMSCQDWNRETSDGQAYQLLAKMSTYLQAAIQLANCQPDQACYYFKQAKYALRLAHKRHPRRVYP